MTGNLASILQWLYPATVPLRDWTVADTGDGNGPRIAAWNVAGVPQPTEASVAAREADWLAAVAADAPNLRSAAVLGDRDKLLMAVVMALPAAVVNAAPPRAQAILQAARQRIQDAMNAG